MKVAIVDDDPYSVKYVKHALERAGAEVEIIDDTHDVLERIAESNPDVVTVDLYIAYESTPVYLEKEAVPAGVRLCSDLRERNPNLAIAVYTNASEENVKYFFRNQGFQPTILSKSMLFDEVVPIILRLPRAA